MDRHFKIPSCLWWCSKFSDLTIFVPKLLPPAAWCGTHVTSEQNLAIEPGQDKEEEHLLLGAATSTRIITTMTSSIQQTQAQAPSHTFNFHYGLVVVVCVGPTGTLNIAQPGCLLGACVRQECLVRTLDCACCHCHDASSVPTLTEKTLKLSRCQSYSQDVLASHCCSFPCIIRSAIFVWNF